ncbi:MAG: sugar phosphate isomerase/epimerase [Opitutaceae bacterium]
MKRLFSRLALFAACAALPMACISRADVGTGSHFKGPVGVQLYSLRGLFIKNGPTTLDAVKAYGVREVELAGTYKQTPAEFRKELDARGLVPVSGHFPFDRFRDDPAGIAKDAKILGLKYAGCAWIPHKETFTVEDAKAAAAVFNRAGDILAKEGIKVFYHCHGYEFQPGIAGEGKTTMDILMTETNPKTVAFEMDILWVVHPGEAPEKWLAKYPGRWELIHLKDYRKGLPTGIHTGKTDPENDVVLGTGQVNWPVVLAAAKKAGVKHYFIEDESSGAATQIPLTLRYLEQVRW